MQISPAHSTGIKSYAQVLSTAPAQNMAVSTSIVVSCPHCLGFSRDASFVLGSKSSSIEQKFEELGSLDRNLFHHLLTSHTWRLPPFASSLRMRISQERSTLDMRLTKITALAEGSLSRLFTHEETRVTQRGYFPHFYLDDALFMLRLFIRQRGDARKLHALEAIILRSIAINKLDTSSLVTSCFQSKESPDVRGKKLAPPTLSTLQTMRIGHELWINLLTGGNRAISRHHCTLSICKVGEDTVDFHIINRGSGRQKHDAKARTCADTNILRIKMDAHFEKSLQLLLSYHPTDAKLYECLEHCWPSSMIFEKTRSVISHDCCVSSAFNAAFQDILEAELYAEFMIFWSGHELHQLITERSNLGQLPSRARYIPIPVINLRGTAQRNFRFLPCLTEEVYTLHTESLASIIFKHYQHLRLPVSNLDRLPESVRELFHRVTTCAALRLPTSTSPLRESSDSSLDTTQKLE